MLGKISIFERLGEEKWRQAVGQLLPVQAEAGSHAPCIITCGDNLIEAYRSRRSHLRRGRLW